MMKIFNTISAARDALSKKQKASQMPSRLLSLLPELRNMIYEAVFADVGEDITINILKGEQLRAMRKVKKVLGLLQSSRRLSLMLTCKQVYEETCGYVHGRLRVEFWYPDVEGGSHARTTLSWLLRQVFFNAHARMITKCLKTFGTKLEYVTRLDLRGYEAAAIMLSVGPETEILQTWLKSSRFWIRHKAQYIDALLKTYAALPNIRFLVFHIDDQYEPKLTHIMLHVRFAARMQFAFPKARVIMVKFSGHAVLWAPRPVADAQEEVTWHAAAIKQDEDISCLEDVDVARAASIFAMVK